MIKKAFLKLNGVVKREIAKNHKCCETWLKIVGFEVAKTENARKYRPKEKKSLKRTVFSPYLKQIWCLCSLPSRVTSAKIIITSPKNMLWILGRGIVWKMASFELTTKYFYGVLVEKAIIILENTGNINKVILSIFLYSNVL